ncbi:hypothetical protein L0F63_006191 [Massospora cicadina]|nr:hypothetical protein L0F63_006191 [Massospora cicadina]
MADNIHSIPSVVDSLKPGQPGLYMAAFSHLTLSIKVEPEFFVLLVLIILLNEYDSIEAASNLQQLKQEVSKENKLKFKGSLSQRTGKKLPSAVKLTSKSMDKALALDKPESKPKAALKCKNPKVFDSEENFEVEAALPTIAKACPIAKLFLKPAMSTL